MNKEDYYAETIEERYAGESQQTKHTLSVKRIFIATIAGLISVIIVLSMV